MWSWRNSLGFITLLILAGCSPQLPHQEDASAYGHPLSSVEIIHSSFQFSQVYQGDSLDKASLLEAGQRSMDYYQRGAADVRIGKLNLNASEMRDSTRLFMEVISRQAEDQWIKTLDEDFYLFASSVNDRNETNGVLFTGYYEPIYPGSLTKRPGYEVPVYGMPKDLLILNLGRFRESMKNQTLIYRLEGDKILPYFDRRAIVEGKALAGKGLEVAWMKSEVDLFFLQVQGSGILVDPEGRRHKLGYAGANGRPYSSIGKYLVDKGKIPLMEITMQSIRKYLEEHPREEAEILHSNESYVFFEVKSDDGPPRGNINQPLTAGRSLAADALLMPKGGLVYWVTDLPRFDAAGKQIPGPVEGRFGFIQDTGGAIKGPGRFDLFWGNGPVAESSAGVMKSYGRIYFLVAKPQALKKARDRWRLE